MMDDTEASAIPPTIEGGTPTRVEQAVPLVRWAALLAGLAVLAMTVVGAVDVLGTLLLGRPLPGAYELIQTLLVGAVVLPMALAQQQGRHIRVTMFLDLMPEPARRGLDIFNALLTLILFALIAWFGWSMAIESTRIGEFTQGLIPFPVWPAKLALATGATLMAMQSMLDLTGGLGRSIER